MRSRAHLVWSEHTTASTILVGLRTFRVREGVPTGLTWGDFKAAMHTLEVEDGDRLASIEFGCKQCGSGRIVRDDAPDGIEIREV